MTAVVLTEYIHTYASVACRCLLCVACVSSTFFHRYVVTSFADIEVSYTTVYDACMYMRTYVHTYTQRHMTVRCVL